MPAVWGSGLQGAPPPQPVRRVGVSASAPEPPEHRETDRSAGQQPRPGVSSRPDSPMRSDRQASPPSWPSSPAHGEPQHPAASNQVDGTHCLPTPLTAAPGDLQAPQGASAEASAASAGLPGSDPATRWPAPNPRAVRESDTKGQLAASPDEPHQESAWRLQALGAGVAAEPNAAVNHEHPAPRSADWRDDILTRAHQPWQPAPSWPHHLVTHRPPETNAPDAGIEPGHLPCSATLRAEKQPKEEQRSVPSTARSVELICDRSKNQTGNRRRGVRGASARPRSAALNARASGCSNCSW